MGSALELPWNYGNIIHEFWTGTSLKVYFYIYKGRNFIAQFKEALNSAEESKKPFMMFGTRLRIIC